MNETHFTEKDRATLTTVEVKLDRAIEDIKNLSSNFVVKSEHAALTERTKNIEDSIKWIIRLVLGLVVTAVVSLVIINVK